MTISYICLYYDKAELNRMLLQSLANTKSNKDSNDHIILIDNSRKQYTSCAQAYNNVLSKEKDLGDILIFLHSDIAFENRDFENRILHEFQKDRNQIIGIAGVALNGTVYSNAKHRQTKQCVAIPFSGPNKIECLSLDECFFAVPKELFLQNQFDECNCFSWHLWATDFCYDVKRKYGVKSYVIPEEVYHKENEDGGLTVDKTFLKTMWKLRKKYKKDFSKIENCCFTCPTHGMAFIKCYLNVHWLKSYPFKIARWIKHTISGNQ